MRGQPGEAGLPNVQGGQGTRHLLPRAGNQPYARQDRPRTPAQRAERYEGQQSAGWRVQEAAPVVLGAGIPEEAPPAAPAPPPPAAHSPGPLLPPPSPLAGRPGFPCGGE